MGENDIKDYAISIIPFVGDIYTGVREGRAVNRHNNRLQEAELKSARAAAVSRALSGRRHSGPAFTTIEKGVKPPDMTKLAIQKGLANLSTEWASRAISGGVGGA